jgi:hypothetical protein
MAARHEFTGQRHTACKHGSNPRHTLPGLYRTKCESIVMFRCDPLGTPVPNKLWFFGKTTKTNAMYFACHTGHVDDAQHGMKMSSMVSCCVELAPFPTDCASPRSTPIPCA